MTCKAGDSLALMLKVMASALGSDCALQFVAFIRQFVTHSEALVFERRAHSLVRFEVLKSYAEYLCAQKTSSPGLIT